jgi:PAS domain-containing protein
MTERHTALVGYMVAVLRTEKMIELAWEGFRNDGIDFWLTDDTNPAQPRTTYSRCSQSTRSGSAADPEPMPAVSPALRQATTIEVAGRRWTLHFVQTPEYIAANRSLQAWTVLSGGMLFTGLLGAVLLVVTGREALIAGIVDERTAALDESRRFAERIAAMLPKILYVYDVKTGADVFANGRMQTILGYTAEESQGPIMDAFRETGMEPRAIAASGGRRSHRD